VNVKHSAAVEFDAKQVKRYIFIQSRIYLLSSLIGDRQKPYNATKGVIGLILWILNLIIHFSLDFYEANTVFHVSWASSIGVFLVMFLVSTVFLIRHTVRWFIKSLKRLSKDKIYNNTFSKLFLVFKVTVLKQYLCTLLIEILVGIVQKFQLMSVGFFSGHTVIDVRDIHIICPHYRPSRKRK